MLIVMQETSYYVGHVLQLRRSHRLRPHFLIEEASQVPRVNQAAVAPYGYDQTDLTALPDVGSWLAPMGIIGTYMLRGYPVIRITGLFYTWSEAEVRSGPRQGDLVYLVAQFIAGCFSCFQRDGVAC